MAFTLVQAGSHLYAVNPEGGVSSALTLPTGITLSSQRIPRFAKFRRAVIVVNTPTRPIQVDTDGVVRVLTPTTPSTTPAATGSNGGTLSGTYQAKQTFILLDSDGNLLSESDFGVASAPVTISAKNLSLTNLSISPDDISASRLYRTTDGGTTFFKWIDLDGNAQTAVADDKPDAELELVAAPSLGAAPDLTLIAEYAGRLWGVSRTDVDTLRYTEAGTAYAWSLTNALPIPHIGEDRFGVTALAPRRDALGVGRRNNIVQIVGNNIASIRPINVTEHCGFLSQEAVVIFRDSVYFLWYDGVYRWDASGITCLSDEAGVRSWFTSNDYFNRGMFSQAWAVFDPVTTTYRLFLCSVGSVVPDRWVEYNLKTGKFYGPHKTNAFVPSCALLVRGTNDQSYPMIGSREGFLSLDSEARSDWDAFPIELRIESIAHNMGDPSAEKYFGNLTVHTHKESGGELDVTTKVGDLDEEATNETDKKNLTTSREQLSRIGSGKVAKVVFENKELNQPVTIYGYEVDPISSIGIR